MNIREKLAAVQAALKAPKGQYNSFGKYPYRSCEDILEAVKPLLKERGLALTLSDDIVECGGRIYIKATACVKDVESLETESTSAFAREPENKKGMDDSQITGTASSYARKYALNGLFCIDDTKDADTEESRGRENTGPICEGCGGVNDMAQQQRCHTSPICEGCGNEIKAVRSNGTVYSAQDIAEKAVSNYGKRLCWSCMKVAKNG